MKKTAMALMILLLALPVHVRAEMIDGLDHLPRMDAQQAAALAFSSDGVLLTVGGEKLPYDAQSNTYYIPQDAETQAFDGSVTLDAQEGMEYALVMLEETDKQTMISESQMVVVVGVKEDAAVMSKIVFTSMPVLVIETDSRQIPGDADEMGRLRIFEASGGEIAVRSTAMEINERGNTSRRFPKRSYRMQLLDDRGEKRNLSIAGLRTDDDWILNPMYTDTSKIREKLAYELWEDVNSSGSRAASSRLEYAEVFFGERYWGLYGVQERVDNKQVAGSKRSDILYKVIANDQPTVQELLSWEDRLRCRAFEPKYGEEYRGTTRQLWTPAAAYMAMLEGETLAGSDSEIDLANAIDYGLWVMITQAYDCHFKNQFLNAVYDDGGYVMYKIPWDTNHTFGDVWDGSSGETNFSAYTSGGVVLDDYFERLLADADAATLRKIRARWETLRRGPAKQERMMRRAREIYDSIYPALLRDGERWPLCGMGEGNAMNIRDVETYFEKTLPVIDAYINALGTQEEGV